jgi:hypothetical protein
MENTVFAEVRGNAIWDGIKEGVKLMIPFLAGLGIKQWFAEHQTAIMWTSALVVAVAIAFPQCTGAQSRSDEKGQDFHFSYILLTQVLTAAVPVWISVTK